MAAVVAFELPLEVLAAVLSRLSVPELGRAACVSVAWRVAAASPQLWQAAFLRLLGPAAAAVIARRALLAGVAPDWRTAASERHRAGVGWRLGRCRVTVVEATSNREAGMFKIVDDHLLACDIDGESKRFFFSSNPGSTHADATHSLFCCSPRLSHRALPGASLGRAAPPGAPAPPQLSHLRLRVLPRDRHHSLFSRGLQRGALALRGVHGGQGGGGGAGPAVRA
jgi:hypothetical protein